MKRCIEEHTVAGFGTIPVGSLWEDDSEFVTDPKLFERVKDAADGDAPPAKPKKKAAARKFGEVVTS